MIFTLGISALAALAPAACAASQRELSSSAPTVAGSGSGALGSPPDTSSNVSVGLTSINGITSCCDQLLNTATPPMRATAWKSAVGSFASGRSQAYYSCPGTNCIFGGYYMPGESESASSNGTPGYQTLAWFETNHPDWIVFNTGSNNGVCNSGGPSVSGSTATQKATNAANAGDTSYYGGGAGNPVPLDFTNASALAWEETNQWAPALAGGGYQFLFIDNIGFYNGSNFGTRCGHFNSSGTWVAQYAGSNSSGGDPAWSAHEDALTATEAAWVHANYSNIGFGGNLAWGGYQPTDEASVLSSLDVFMDEEGYTCGIAPCSGGNPVHGTAWVTKAQEMTTFNNRAVHPGEWFDINTQTDGTTAAAGNITHADINWQMANYLMVKSSSAWVDIVGNQEYNAIGGNAPMAPWYPVVPYSAATVGTATNSYRGLGTQSGGVYQAYERDFTTGHAYVNPNASGSYTVTLPGGTWHDLWGNTQGSTVVLGPETGLVIK